MSRELTPEAAQLKKALRDLYFQQDAQLSDDYNRSLSFADGCFDRWERAKHLGFGEGASIYNSALLFGDISVGEQSWIGPYTVLDGSGDCIKIGAYCSISAGVHIYTHDSVKWAVTGGKSEYKKNGVEISDRCYIGSQSVINQGVKIGTGCVVAANSFVNKSVPDYTIVAGTPAKPIGEVKITDGEVEFIYHRDESE